MPETETTGEWTRLQAWFFEFPYCERCNEELQVGDRVFRCDCGDLVCERCVHTDLETDGWPQMCESCWEDKDE